MSSCRIIKTGPFYHGGHKLTLSNKFFIEQSNGHTKLHVNCDLPVKKSKPVISADQKPGLKAHFEGINLTITPGKVSSGAKKTKTTEEPSINVIIDSLDILGIDGTEDIMAVKRVAPLSKILKKEEIKNTFYEIVDGEEMTVEDIYILFCELHKNKG